MRFESRRGPKRREKNALCKLKGLVYFMVFFYYWFSFVLQR
jgi:hypothetical protein